MQPIRDRDLSADARRRMALGIAAIVVAKLAVHGRTLAFASFRTSTTTCL